LNNSGLKGMGVRAHVARFTSKKRELMRAVWRLGMMAFAAGLMLAPLPALAQDAATATTPSSTPATDAVGPRDLQNFTLNGTVTRSADPVAVPRSTAPRPTAQPPRENNAPLASASPAPRSGTRENRPVGREPIRRAAAESAPAPAPAAPPPLERTSAAQPGSSVTVALPPIDEAPVSTAAAATLAPPTDTLDDQHRLLLWPWLLAAVALGAGAAFLFWRSHRGREALAGGPQIDAFVAPEPLPRPTRAPAPPAPVGIVSTRLRPWIDLAFQPGRCIVEDDHVSFEFELALQNSGNAPARAVLVEASLMNAGPYQDDEISAFYGAPVGEGERIAVIPPLKTFLVQTKVIAPRASVQLIEIGGRRVFVPLIAFNTLYSWSTGEGQTSASYLLGRDTKSDKLGPFRLDLGPRLFRSVGARLLPIAVRK
jgi:hypothetical protein